MEMMKIRMKAANRVVALTGLSLLVAWGLSGPPVQAQGESSRYFPETGHTVKGNFLQYWQSHGGLAQQGYPLSEVFTEVSDLDGKAYEVQYFERAVFERHQEKQPPFDVLLSQLGTFRYRAKYGETGAPAQQPNTQNSQTFAETGHSVGGGFLSYWKEHGGLAQQGYPISDEFSEVSDLDGKTYTVQYFERAVFEMHPEKQPPYNVLLSQLGTFQLKQKYPQGTPGGEGQPQPTPQPTTTPQPTRSAPPPPPAATPTQKVGTNCKPPSDSQKSTVSSNGPVAIASVQAKGDEYVTISNNGQAPADISRWTLRDKNDPGQHYIFPAGTQLPANGSIEIYTKAGHQYTFNSNKSIWNDCGDSLELLNADGAVVATYAYGTHLR